MSANFPTVPIELRVSILLKKESQIKMYIALKFKIVLIEFQSKLPDQFKSVADLDTRIHVNIATCQRNSFKCIDER